MAGDGRGTDGGCGADNGLFPGQKSSGASNKRVVSDFGQHVMGKTMGRKQRFFTCPTDFALISKVCIR